MTGNFNIATLNVRGAIKKPDKRINILSGIKLNNLDILLLQETHVNNLKIKFEIDRFFDCQSFWSFGSNDSRGVAILLMNNFNYEITKFDTDNEGRILKIVLQTNLGCLNIINIYAPNDASNRKIFFKSIDHFFIGASPIILGGDFNCIEDLQLDKIGGNPMNGREGSV